MQTATINPQVAEIEQQIADLKACQGSMPQGVYINTLTTLEKTRASLLGTEYRKDGLLLNVPAPRYGVKDKTDRDNNVIERDVPCVKGGLITASGTIQGKKINKVFLNVELVEWIINNADGIKSYLSQPHMEYRHAGQTDIHEGSLKGSDLFQ